MSWLKELQAKVKKKEPLKYHTTFRIGGPARYMIEPKDAGELRLLLNSLKRYKIPLFVMGSGSNILAVDSGVNAVVLRLGAPFFRRVSFDKNFVSAGSGCGLGRVGYLAQKQGLSGLEFLAGIPGTIGGALIMNAGTKDASISDAVDEVTAVDDNGEIITLHKKDIDFKYRDSGLSKYILISARLKLTKLGKKDIRNRINEYMSYRKMTQDLSNPSAGCVFKNPPGDSAGRLIDSCGLKGRKIGGACISKKHANFILNLRKARADDVLALMELAKDQVKDKFNITLEPEIKIWK